MKYIRGCEINQLEVADDFYEAYLRCFEINEDKHYIEIPAFVNGFFACEIYLKCLSKSKKIGHNLKELYNSLEEKYKEEIRLVPCDKKYTLEELLNDIGDGFYVWRYIYEENKKFENKYPFEYSEYFLRTYLPVFKQMAEREFKK